MMVVARERKVNRVLPQRGGHAKTIAAEQQVIT